MLVSSIMAIAYNLVHALMIKNVSVVATTVLGEFKIICLLVLSAMLLGEGRACRVRRRANLAGAGGQGAAM